LALLVFWYTPAFLYATNEDQFYFPLLQVLPVLAIPLVGAVVLAVLPALLMPSNIKRYYAAFLACVTVYFWVHGFLFVRDYGLLDGRIELPPYSPAPLFVIAAVIGGAAILVARVRPTVLVGAFIAVVAVLLVHIGVLVATDPNPVRSIEPAKVGSLYELGSENLLIVLLDSFQSDVFAEVIEDRPEIAGGMEGFTYFPNTLGVGATTYGSLPTIHSGRVRQPGESMTELFTTAIARDSYETELAGSGWDVTHVNPIGDICPAKIDDCFLYDPNRRAGSTTRLFKQPAELLDLAAFRLVPDVLKGRVYDDNKWWIRTAFKSVSIQESSDTALVEITNNLRRTDTAKSMKFLHMQQTHAPITRRADCSLLDKPAKVDRKSALGIGTCALTRFVAMTKKLQEIDSYDNTSIVLLADHGYKELPSRSVSDPELSKLVGLANPLLAVKPAGAKGPFRSSDAQMSLVDVKTIVCSLTKGCEGASDDWASPDVNRPRFFMNYEWHDAFWLATTLKDERRYEVRGPMTDPASWKDLGSGPVPQIPRLGFDADDRLTHFGYGWAAVEDGARWVQGSKASLNLRLPDDADPRLEFDIEVLPEHKQQTITLKVNGTLVGTVKAATGRSTVSFVVPRGASTAETDEVLLSFAQHREGDPHADRHTSRMQSLAVRFHELRLTYPR
jgi:hypothetical protein